MDKKIDIQVIQILEKIQTNWILLREVDLTKEWGDIDILVEKPQECYDILKKEGYSCYEINVYTRKYAKYSQQLKNWIYLDVHEKIVYGNLTLLWSDICMLVKGNRLNEELETLLTFIHVILTKKDVSIKYEEYFRRKGSLIFTEFSVSNPHLKLLDKCSKIYRQFPDPLRENFLEAKIALSSLLDHSLPSQSLVARIINRVKVLVLRSNSLVILGPDGSGKSTLTREIAKLEWPRAKYQYMGPGQHSRLGKAESLERKVHSMLHNNSQYPIVLIFSKVLIRLFYMLDYALRIGSHLYSRGSGHWVIYDRYPCDMYIRSRKRLDRVLFYWIFGMPKNVVICVGDANHIYKRKPDDLSVEGIRETIEEYKTLLKGKDIIFVDTVKDNIECNLNKVYAHIFSKNKC